MKKSTALPLAFMARMAALLDEEFPAFLLTLSQPPETGLRVNTLKLAVARLLELSPWPLQPTPWCPEGFLLPRNTNAGLYPLHEAGLYYLQEPSTMAVATLLAPQPGERVLDLCAAPGGKSTHMAALLAGQGLLVANEIDRQRAEVLARNLERWGSRNVVALNETPQRLAERWPDAFDRVLVDAPCSGEGMFRKSEEARYHWSEAHVAGCALRQDEILDSAGRLVRPGGLIGYATCTFAPEENEGSTARFLARHPEFTLEEPAWYPGFSPGQSEWRDWPKGLVAGRQAAADSEPSSGDASSGAAPGAPGPAAQALQRAVRIWPHRAPGEGHFVALLRRGGDGPPGAWEPARLPKLPTGEQAALQDFWRSTLTLPLPERLMLRPRDRLTAAVYALAPDAPELEGLMALRPGWRLGTLAAGERGRHPPATHWRFEPAHALALAIRAEDAQQRLDEPAGSELIARYLRGETLAAPGPDGWLLICVDGFPLGWGKRTAGVVKNHYPKGLRWQ